MLFSQLTFLPFFALVLIGHLLTRRSRFANNLFLLIASWVFFLYWSVADFAIFLSVMAINYVFLRALERSSRSATRRAWLLGSLAVSLGTLGLFKYRQFFGENATYLLNLVGIPCAPPAGSILIPLAISFYTFHMISLICDVHDRKYAAPSFLDYALYLSFFPQMLAGPIVRGNQLLPQILRQPRERDTDVTNGVYNFVLGYFFKVVIADHVADAIEPYWLAAGLATASTADVWCVALMYSCQIFADFAGYSFMAIGLGKLLGFSLPENFNAPYLAGSFREFWQRWHMTLSAFLRDYLYIGALGGNRGGKWRTCINLLVTMLLGGLWHGPAWNFLAWGAVHGVGLTIERLLGLGYNKVQRSRLSQLGWASFVQLTVLLAWILFRAPNLEFALVYLKRMFLLDGSKLSWSLAPSLGQPMLLVLPVVVHHLARAWPWSRVVCEWTVVRAALGGALLYAVCVFLHDPRGFIYFVF